MADWATFTGFSGVLLVLLLALTHASQSVFTDESHAPTDRTATADNATQPVDGSVSNAADRSSTAGRPTTTERPPAEQQTTERPPAGGPTTEPDLSTLALLANVAVSQGVLAVLLVTMAWYTEIPAWAFGLAAESLALGGVATGIAVGSVFYICNEAAAVVGRQWGFSTPTGLREALAPETAAGWAVLLVVVLPIIAGFEELLFRGVLIGVVHAGFELPIWLLAVGSSVAFALGHGAQGRLGIVVTGLLGGGLAAVFVLTGSLVVVIVAHYVINVLEFVVHEGVEPISSSHK